MRLFAAIPLPPQAMERLSAVRLRLATPEDGLRWTSPEQWHITLRFFGDLDTGACAALQDRIQTFPSPDVALRLEALGRFPAKGILYAAIEPSESLLALHQALASWESGDSRLSQGARVTANSPATAPSLPFHPHITLARSKGRVGLRTLQRLGSPALPQLGAPVSWRAREICLFESVPGPGGARYTLVATTPPPS